MILKSNGQVVIDPLPISETTAQYLSKFWKLPTKDEYLAQRETILTSDSHGSGRQ